MSCRVDGVFAAFRMLSSHQPADFEGVFSIFYSQKTSSNIFIITEFRACSKEFTLLLTAYFCRQVGDKKERLNNATRIFKQIWPLCKVQSAYLFIYFHGFAAECDIKPNNRHI